MVLLWGYEKNRNTTLVFENNSNEKQNPLFTKQKPPFRNAKRGFLEDKKGGFATQKYGCCNVLSIRRLCKRVVFAEH